MLKYFEEKGLLKIFDQQPSDWEEAVRMSGLSMLENHIINEQYIDEVIESIHELGPYIVIVPHVAMPHSQAKSEGVLGTGISLSIFPGPVSFEANNPEMDAELFFMLAAKNPEEHLENIKSLTELLLTEHLIEDLINVKTIEDYHNVIQKYNF
ncbi:PTS sugar transporter subunit IIA [Streptococcus pacificus]|uniref:Ascorbate-specific PTS system EIIA component n=1 Tax=Streptococcus pacificus TaxID=2740577 RepID=A0ABS0ZJR1_9STRE|nr:PTS sugar transporter subunit IIA [Streptococcus pacificus]MBJ8325771.1 PTS sugar transporter subunit IIA [Streptococcus pacificus]